MAEFPGIPGYKIISKLGEGGMATVYLGIQEKLNRKVAIKILEPSLLKDEVIRSRFEREAKTAASLSNFNVVQVFDTGKKGEYYYIVMEYLQESLRDRMKLDPQGRVKPEKALGIIEELMGALDYMHFLGVHHRDIKPENIMFRQDDTPVLVDFGIARAVDKTDGKDLTTENIVPGTPHYMSPEQCKAQKMDWRSDIYSLGVVLYELLTGKRPFEDETSIAVVLNHIQSPIPRLPEELKRYQPLIDKMLTKDKEKRLEGGTEFKQLVEKIEMPPSQMGTVQPDVNFKSIIIPIRLLFKKYLDLVSEKLDLLMKDLMKKLGTFIHSIKERLKLIIDYLVKKKLFPKVLLVIFFGVIFIIIIIRNLGTPGRKSDSNVNQSFISHYVGEFNNYLSQLYQKNLKDLEALLKERNLERLESGRKHIDKLLQIKRTLELQELGEKIPNRIIELEVEFRKHITSVWDFYRNKKYSEAWESLLQAKEIKTTEELMFLEKRIEEQIQKSKKKKKGITLTGD